MRLRSVCYVFFMMVMGTSLREPGAVGPGPKSRCIAVRQDWPLTHTDPVVPSHNLICYSGNMAGYELLWHYDSTRNQKTYKSGIWHYFLVFDTASRYGVLYDPEHGHFRGHVLVDSALKMQWFSLVDVNGLMKSDLKLVSAEKTDGHLLTETYRLNCDTVYARIVLRYDDDYRDIDFSYSRQLDSVKGSKLRDVALYYYYGRDFAKVADSAKAVRVPFVTYKMDEVDSAGLFLPFFKRYAQDSAKTTGELLGRD